MTCIFKMASIYFILDRSGSMEMCQYDTIQGFNRFVESQNKDCNMSLFLFNNQLETVYFKKPIGEVRDLTMKTFRPMGGTALFDAIGKVIKFAEDRDTTRWADLDEGVSNIIVVMTDGHENSSESYTKSQIRDFVTMKQAVGWNFMFLGANQDAVLAAKNIGICHDSAMTFSVENVSDVMSSASSAISRCIMGETQDIQFTQDERLASLGMDFM